VAACGVRASGANPVQDKVVLARGEGRCGCELRWCCPPLQPLRTKHSLLLALLVSARPFACGPGRAQGTEPAWGWNQGVCLCLCEMGEWCVSVQV